MRNEIGQHLFIGLEGKTLKEDEKKFIVQNNIGGVILFTRNFEAPAQLRDLCAEIQSLRHRMPDKAPLFISVDQEGGRVARFRAPLTLWPPLKKLGDLDSPSVSFGFAASQGRELRALGINLNFAPCADILTNPANTAIGDRAISSDPEIVAKHVSALIRGYMKADVHPCVKHFPGHGGTLIDSHFELPVENADLQRLEEVEFIPFKRAIKSRVEFVMMSHLKFPKIDPDFPVSLSEIFVKKYLKESLRYRGFVITDDLGMKALTLHYPAEFIPVRALQTGTDFLLYCNEFDAPPKAMESLEKAVTTQTLNKDLLAANHKRILDWKRGSLKNPDPVDLNSCIQIVGHSDHYKLSQAIANGEVPSGLVSMP